MGHKSKTPKGEISITNSKGRITLRWLYTGERYSFNLSYAYQPENMHHAAIKVAENPSMIGLEILGMWMWTIQFIICQFGIMFRKTGSMHI